MSTYERKYIHETSPYKRDMGNSAKEVQNIYYGEVISIEDDTDGGRIKTRIADLDKATANDDLPWCYPILPKFIHLYPKVGEVVRIFIEDTKYPQRSRFWTGTIISQLQKINFDSFYTALSTTNVKLTKPENAISTYPDAKGVFPEKEDIALLGRNNTDVILRINEAEIRAGKHEYNDVFKLNRKNPASIKLTFDITGDTTTSSSIIMSDKIALISHEGIPKFKSTEIDQQERQRIFSQGHPLGRGDVIVDALEILRKAIIQHIHPYSGVPSDKSGILIDLEKIDFTQILQKNIVIN
jgi:hypothetical protein